MRSQHWFRWCVVAFSDNKSLTDPISTKVQRHHMLSARTDELRVSWFCIALSDTPYLHYQIYQWIAPQSWHYQVVWCMHDMINGVKYHPYIQCTRNHMDDQLSNFASDLLVCRRRYRSHNLKPPWNHPSSAFQGPLFLTWFNFNPNMDKQLHPQ